MTDAERDWIQGEFNKLKSQLDDMPCAMHGERLAGLEQSARNDLNFASKLNHNKRAAREYALNIWRIVIAALGLAFVILKVLGK